MSDYAIGIDPSLTGTAICGAFGGLETVKGGDGDGRLTEIYDAVEDAVTLFRVNGFVIVEDLPYNARSAGATGLAHGVVRLALLHASVRYMLIPPATLKKYVTGKGNATKADMRVATLQRAGFDERDDNKVDAFWLKQIGAYAVGESGHLRVPKAQRECLFKLDWPEDIAAKLLEPYEAVVAS